MNIGEFSNKTDLTIDTLRYYNKIGLLVPSRNKNKRDYNEEDFEKALAINKLKNLNFSLAEIKALFSFEETIESHEKINDTTVHSLTLCLDMMNSKLQNIIKQQQDLLLIKTVLEKMILKTNKLLENQDILKVLK